MLDFCTGNYVSSRFDVLQSFGDRRLCGPVSGLKMFEVRTTHLRDYTHFDKADLGTIEVRWMMQ